MSEFFQTHLQLDKHRIDVIEPFDEFEDLFLKCNHYSLLCAANGNCTPILRRLVPFKPTEFETPSHGVINADYIPLTKSCVVIKRLAFSYRLLLALQHGFV